MELKQLPRKFWQAVTGAVMFLANNPRVRKMLWGWAVDSYQAIKKRLKRKENVPIERPKPRTS
jgi:hypothetical protein